MLASHACSAFWRCASFATPVACADHRNVITSIPIAKRVFAQLFARGPSQGTYPLDFCFKQKSRAAGGLRQCRVVSRDNVDTVRRACEAWGAGDISIYRAMYAPDATAHAGLLAPEFPGGEITGPDQIMAVFESLMATFEQSELIPEGFIEDGDSLVVPVVMRAVTRESPATVEWHLAIAYRFRDGLIVHQAWHPTLEEALDSAGFPQSAAERA
jgi:ketosteroid isomerase-like protein